VTATDDDHVVLLLCGRHSPSAAMNR